MTPADWQSTPLMVPLLVTGLSCAWIAYISWRRRAVPEALPFAILMAAIAGWTLLSIVEKSINRVEPRDFVSALVYIFIVTTPAAWLAFALKFVRQDQGLWRWAPLVLAIEPALVLGLVFTDPYHRLFRFDPEMRFDGPYPVMPYTYGPLFWVHTAYTYAVFALGGIGVVIGVSRRPDWTPFRMAVVLAGMLVPTLGNVAYVMRWQPIRWGDLTPMYFAVTGLAAAWMLFHVRLFDILPIARGLVLDCLPDAVIVLDHRGRILDANPMGSKLLPRPLPSLRRHRLADVVPSLEPYLSPLPNGTLGDEIRLSRAGEERVWDMYLLPIVDFGATVGYLLRLADVTALRQAEEERGKLLVREGAARAEAERLWREARDAEKRKDAFLALLAHELRNPLTSIHNALHLIARDRNTGPALDILDRQARHLGRLVEDLLDVSRIARGKVELRCETLDLVAVVRAAAEDQRAAIAAAQVVFDLGLPMDPIWVWADPVRLAQVVANLLVNAAKFTPAGGRIALTVAVASQSQAVRVTVTDTGIGIEPEFLPRVFNAFAQGPRGKDAGKTGLGLGLALVHGLVRLLGGEVSAASAGPGQGSAFSFWLPIHDGSQRLASALIPEQPATRLARRILLIDDHPDTAETMRLLLAGAGHEVHIAHSAAEALKAAGDFSPELIFSDVALPDVDGHTLARMLRGERKTACARLIAVSGSGHPDDRRRAKEAGFDMYFTKPVDPHDLLRIVSELPPPNIAPHHLIP